MSAIDIEEINRENFKSLKTALTYPGSIKTLEPLFGSPFLATASVLLFNEVSFYYSGSEDMESIEVITNAQSASPKEADYIFSDTIDEALLEEAKVGNYLSPDFSATLLFKCDSLDVTEVELSGPGIDKSKKVTLPCSQTFIEKLMEKNSDYPLGVEVFFISKSRELMGISRTTKIKAL